MLNKLSAFAREQRMLAPGDTVVCAVSGGVDSVALLFALYLLKEKLDFRLEAAHFNHHLRGEESDRDAAFVQVLCDRYDIPLHLGGGRVKAGKKGLEAAAREARYAFFDTLPGKIATAHTADDNAETVLMHMIRGTGLKGLGGIAPIRGRIIRPMLTVTRQEAEGFLEEWCLGHIEDSSNDTDLFLRNRIRRHILPLMKAENPRLAENLSQMALRLRLDEAWLTEQSAFDVLPGVEALKAMHPARRVRCLEGFLKDNGVREPEERHLRLVEELLFSEKPSARASLPGGITVSRRYDRLEVLTQAPEWASVVLECPGQVKLPGFRVSCCEADSIVNTADTVTVVPQGTMVLRSRLAGDSMRLSGGSKSLKKLFIDRKIPAARRSAIPVLADGEGVLGVYSIGVNLDRAAQQLPAVTVRFEEIDNEGE